MTDRPTEIRVGPYTYKIEFLSDKKWLKTGHINAWGGESDHEMMMIWLRLVPGRSEDSLKETLLHEILHCVFTVVGLNRYTRPRKGELDEYLIQLMAPTLLRVLQDSPEVLKYMTE